MKRQIIFLVLSILIIQSLFVVTANAELPAQNGSQNYSIEALPSQPGIVVSPSNLQPLPREAQLKYNHLSVKSKNNSELQNLKNQPYAAGLGLQPLTVEDSNLNFAEPLALAPDTGVNFEGLDDLGQPDGWLHMPPDPIIAVGPNHIMTMVNCEFGIYTKTGTLLYEQSFQNWWSTAYLGSIPFDPRIVYDPQDGHWIMVTLVYVFGVRPVSLYLLSVSQTSDPMGSWWLYVLDGKLNYGGFSTWADYPDIGFDGIPAALGGAIYLTSNQFRIGPNSFTTSLLNVMPKSALYNGSISNFRIYNMLNADGSQAFTLRTATTYGNPGKEFLINTSPMGGDKATLWNVVPTFPSAPTVTRQATITIGSYSVPPNAKQLGGTALLDTIDNRMYNCIYQNGYVYAAFTEAYNWGTPSNTDAAIRYLKISTTTNTATINMRYGGDNYYYWFPAITVDNQDNIFLVFARSSATEYAGIHYTGQKTIDANPQPSTLLKSGEAYITGTRWGDYFGIQKDPADTSKVWIYGEWAKDCPGITSEWDWGTWIGRVSFASATVPNLYFPMDEGRGSIVNDLSGNANNGAFNPAANNGAINGATWTAGQSGQSLSFNGLTDYVQVPDSATLDGLTGDMTISLWVRPGASQKMYADMISKHYFNGWAIEQDAANANRFYFAWNTGSSWTGTAVKTTLTANTWQHFVIVKSGTTITHYVNGVQTATGVGSTSAISTNDLPVRIANNAGGFSRQFAGTLDEVQIFSRALSVGEVAAIYGSGHAAVRSGLVGEWLFDEGTGTTAYDSRMWTTGKYGQALIFNGVTDYVQVPDSASLDSLTGDMTISLWVKPEAIQKPYTNLISKHYFNGWTIEQDAGNANRFYFAWHTGSTWTGTAAKTTLTASVWQHFVIIKSGTTITHYLNGVQTATGAGAAATVTTNNLPLRIANNAGGFNRQFAGTIDDVRIYNRALTPAEVSALYTTPP